MFCRLDVTNRLVGSCHRPAAAVKGAGEIVVSQFDRLPGGASRRSESRTILSRLSRPGLGHLQYAYRKSVVRRQSSACPELQGFAARFELTASCD